MESRLQDAVNFFQPKLKGERSREFYCYVYEIGGVPVYVGIGKEDRYLHHLSNALRPGKAVSGIAGRLKAYKKDMDGSLVVRFSLHSNKRENVIAREIELIAKFGRRKDGGTLLNSTTGGDGGNTHDGRFFVNNGVEEKLAFRVPKGWTKGALPRTTGYKWWNNPTTGKEIRLPAGEDGPKGFILGKKKGLKTGPTGTTIWHHPKTGHRVWLREGEDVPCGYKLGRGGMGSTENRIACYNPTTGKMKFIKQGQRVPTGFVKGGRPAPNGKPCQYKKTRYASVQHCVEATGLTRHALYQSPHFKKEVS